MRIGLNVGDELRQTYYNANKTPATQVASLYVKNSHLDQLTSRDNIILVGPRGSGKTTLMKMLTREALDVWATPKAKELISRPVFSIYIGSDTVVRSQLQAPEEILTGKRDLASFAIVRRAKLGLHFLQTVLAAAHHEVRRDRAELELASEERAVTRLADAYRVPVSFSSFEALSDAVSDLVLDLSAAIQAAADNESSDIHRLARFVRVPALADLITTTQEIISEAFRGIPPKWALLFDEIEYMPEASRREILQLIRSLGSSFSVKIAFTPLSRTTDYFAEVQRSFLHEGHDFQTVSLEFEDTRAIMRFATDLHENVLARVLDHHLELPEVFGVSAFAEPRLRNRYPERRLAVTERPTDDDLVAELCQKQPRFKRYAERHGFLTEAGVAGLEPLQRSATFRKALPVMLLWRERLRTAEDQGDRPVLVKPRIRTKRGRKSHAIYAGFPTFLLLSDGNPRVMMGILNRLLGFAKERTGFDTGDGPFFPPDWQDTAIDNARTDQLALANAYMSVHGRVLDDLFAVEVLHGIGQRFEQAVHFGPEFNPDPATSFRVDTELAPPLRAAIVDAVYTGALVELDAVRAPEDVIQPESDLVGRRFRLSYLQGYNYWLPTRKGRQTQLSTLTDALAAETDSMSGTWSKSDQARMF